MRLLFCLNELNFDFIEKYIKAGLLPGFTQLLKQNRLVQTISETEYKNQEPWIQWVTVQTGKSYGEHGVFRLGDIVEHNYEQIWEAIERQGKTVAATSPMNASNTAKSPDWFIPDPWTQTKVSGSHNHARLSRAINTLVNANSGGKSGLASYINLLIALLTCTRASMWPALFFKALKAFSKKGSWAKAIWLDELIFSVHITALKAFKTQFSSLFLNAAAHIQHHYAYNSKVLAAQHSNPPEYCDPECDPLQQVLQAYDGFITQLINDKSIELVIVTGLSQRLNPKPYANYRPLDHRVFLDSLDVPFQVIQPRMSRDMLLHFSSKSQLATAKQKLESFTLNSGERLFSTDERDNSLFVKIDYHGLALADVHISEEKYRALSLTKLLTLVSIENAIHRTIGYFIDCNMTADFPNRVNLTSLFDYIAFNKLPAKYSGPVNN